MYFDLEYHVYLIYDVQRSDKIDHVAGSFRSDQSQSDSTAHAAGRRQKCNVFWAKRVFVKIQKMKTFSEQNATNLASGDGGRKGLEQLIPQLQVFVCLLCLFCVSRFQNIFFFSKRH